ncbi:hypothetical protein [Streptomyces parvulus]|uniref:hypothetical protein n=1 Tax=Streptomyces parvulus TaxID=146923 RepID=UPI00340BD9FF
MTTTLPEPTDLQVAIHVGQRLLDSDNVLSLQEALRLILRALGAEPDIAPPADEPPAVQATPTEVHHANGATYKVIEASSYTARMARDVHDVTMADGTVWKTGQPIGWHGTPAAWQPGCGAPAAVCIEGYSPRDGLAHGSLDHTVYACAGHTADARADWLSGYTTYTCTGTPEGRRCGERFDYTALGGGQ